jgi:CBS domain containing-hemolysin-like protein
VRNTVTGSEAGDAFLAVAIVGISMVFMGLGILVGPAIYFSLRTSRPAFARAAGTATLVILALVFGALMICVASFTSCGILHH